MGRQGKSSLKYENPPCVIATGCVAGQKEGEGPLGELFDEIVEDPMAGTETWEEAESELQRRAAQHALEKSGLNPSRIRYLFAGDLLGQSIVSTFGLMKFGIPLFGLYGACSTMGESLALGSAFVNAGYGEYVMCVTSSHFASAEKQFRFPLDYGNQRPYAATWTVTGSGAVILGERGGNVCIKGITTGKIMDYGIRDSMNMGAAMAPAAAEVIHRNLLDFGVGPDYYDHIVTGDLGTVGQQALIDLLKQKNCDISGQHLDCGMMIFDSETQDTHAGGSGCGCAAITLCGKLIRKLEAKEWRRILFVPTGALLSPTSYNEGQNIPGIAHAIILERR